jgi:hypothetical protein
MLVLVELPQGPGLVKATSAVQLEIASLSLVERLPGEASSAGCNSGIELFPLPRLLGIRCSARSGDRDTSSIEVRYSYFKFKRL